MLQLQDAELNIARYLWQACLGFEPAFTLASAFGECSEPRQMGDRHQLRASEDFVRCHGDVRRRRSQRHHVVLPRRCRKRQEVLDSWPVQG